MVQVVAYSRFSTGYLSAAVALAVFLSPTLGRIAAGQTSAEFNDWPLSEMELIERVADLQRQLESDQVSEREQAGEELLRLGPRVLDHLEDPDAAMTSDARQRLSSLRRQLETLLVRDIAKSSVIDFVSGWTIEKTLAELGSQTANVVQLAAQVPDATREKVINLPSGKVAFWDLMNQILAQANLEIDRYAGNGSTLILNPRTSDHTAPAEPPSDHQGVFQFVITRIDASRNLASPAHNAINLAFDMLWEPRVGPISIRIPAASIKVVDDLDKPVSVIHPNAVFGLSVQPEIPFLEVAIPIQLVDRKVASLKSVTLTAEAILPGRIETFRFGNIGRAKPGASQQKAGAIVTVERIDQNENLYGVTVSLAFEEEFRALESHQSWVFDNPLWLEDKNGNRSDPIAMETVRQDNSGVAITFMFPDRPTDQTLVYQTPAAIVQSEVEIKLENIPLP